MTDFGSLGCQAVFSNPLGIALDLKMELVARQKEKSF